MNMPDSDASGPEKANGYKTTRRGLVAAAAVFATMLTAKKAHAFALPPRGGRDGPKGGHSCFLRGTRILTPQGEVKVEELAVGDLVTTYNGASAPIKWIGRRGYVSSQAERWPGELLPIKIAAGAIGPSIPHTDLYVSAMHAVFIDGLLIPARNLVNGRTIVHCSAIDADTIEYFHIELASHNVIFSEGAPTETLLISAEERPESFGLGADDTTSAADGEHLPSYAPRVPANRSAVIRARLRSAASPMIDLRRPGDAVWDRLAERAESMAA